MAFSNCPVWRSSLACTLFGGSTELHRFNFSEYSFGHNMAAPSCSISLSMLYCQSMVLSLVLFTMLHMHPQLRLPNRAFVFDSAPTQTLNSSGYQRAQRLDRMHPINLTYFVWTYVRAGRLRLCRGFRGCRVTCMFRGDDFGHQLVQKPRKAAIR